MQSDDETEDDESEDVQAPRPAKSKGKPKRRKKRRPRYEPPPGRRWTTGHLAVSLVVGLGIGGVIGYESRGSEDQVPVRDVAAERPAAAPNQPVGTATTDRFGRAPGDKHFGHSHPLQPGPSPGSAPDATDGGTDSFGRAPGDQHFGHSHP